MAHNDDEYFIASRILFEVRQQNTVYCVFTTDSTVSGRGTEVRRRESIRALTLLGVRRENIYFIGQTCGISDGSSYRAIQIVYNKALETFRSLNIARLYVMAWEGGHVDHDTAHLVGAALSRTLGLEGQAFEFSAYNNFRMPWKLYRAFRFVRRNTEQYRRALCRVEAFRCFLLFRCYPSQWRSILGLLPDAFYRLVICREEWIRAIDGIDYQNKPYNGELFFEKRFKVTYSKFSQCTKKFIDTYLKPRSERDAAPLPLN